MRTRTPIFASLYLFLLGWLFSLHAAVSAPLLPPLNSTDTGESIPGKFIWFELATVDVDQQKAFYGDVFGWTFNTISETDDQYTLIMHDGNNIAGLFHVKPREGVKLGALWLGMMSVKDPDAAVTAVQKLGGSVHMPPTHVAQRGTYALLKDPEGALFGVLKSDSGDPPDNKATSGEFLWIDLFTKDLSSAAKFYQQLADYKVETKKNSKGIQRLLLFASNHYRAGIVPLPEGVQRAGWLPYIKVDDVAATLKKVEAAGGTIMVAPDKSLLNGNLAIFADPQGGVMGVVKWGQP